MTFSLARFFIVIAVAAAANVLVHLVGSAVGAGMAVTMSGGMDVALPAAFVATVAPLALAGILAWLVTRRWVRVLPFARVGGLVVAAASAVMPLIVAVDTPTAAALAAMHLVAGAAWYVGTRPRVS